MKDAASSGRAPAGVNPPLAGIAIRPVRADDKQRLLAAFRGLEPQSIYLRFFFPKKELSDEELRRVTEPNPAREAFLVATTGSGAEQRIVALGGYGGGRGCAQLEFVVEEDFQGRGIAKALLQRLVELARKEGIARFDAHVLAANGPMLSVLRHSGLRMAERQAEGAFVVTLFLDDGGPPARAP